MLWQNRLFIFGINMQKIAVVGSAFNPPTLGHKDLIEQCLQAGFREIYLVPVYQHPWGKEMADYKTRLKMLTLFVEDLNQPQLKIKAIEDKIKQGKTVYTIELMDYLKTLPSSKNKKLYFVIGPDNAQNIDKFYQGEQLQKKHALFIANNNIAIRSTIIRNLIHQGQDISAYTTSSVANFLTTHSVY